MNVYFFFCLWNAAKEISNCIYCLRHTAWPLLARWWWYKLFGPWPLFNIYGFSFPGVNNPGPNIVHWLVFSDNIMNGRCYTCSPPVYLQCILRDKLSFTVTLSFFFQALNFLVESFGLLNDRFPVPSILDAGYPVFDLHLADVLFDVILPSVLGSSLSSFG